MGTRSCAGEHGGRKGKKNSSERPKQPQRGLGVAQLEKMRMSGQMGLYQLPSFHVPFDLNQQDETMSRSPVYFSSPPPSLSSSPSTAAHGYLPKNMVGMKDHEGIRYYDFQSEAAKRSIYSNNSLQYQPSTSSDMVATCLQLPMERLPRHQGKDSGSLGSESTYSEDVHDIDLNLKLWI
ncbi:protein SPEAR1-like isoform X2 [Nymphaea colorata]|uniref:protein SPEAR1-like isoform X2 n=1 Tax=Nymphaea colorata TaxID=210225 RepID=UPI00129E0500|nr:protein SPEAR1-like isoform X2 [Nymphaea colorata]